VGINAVAGVTAIDTNVAAVTVKVAEPVWPPKVAVMRAVPAATPVAAPDLSSIVATLRVAEVQLEDAVTSLVDPSLYVAVATNFWAAPIGIEAVAGVTATETRPGKPKVGAPRIGSRPPSPPPHAATKTLRSNAMNHGRTLE
jgi:hypothetical protein